MSKKFTPDPLALKPTEKAPFEVAWPLFSPGTTDFLLDSSLKEREEKILKEAREKAFLIEKEAYEKGFAQGEKDGRELGFKRLEIVAQQLGNVLIEIKSQMKKVEQMYEHEMLRLMLHIGKRIFRQAALAQEGVIVEVLREAFHYVSGQAEVTVHLHPTDYQYLLDHLEDVPIALDEKKGIRIVQDPSITRGGCFLKTSFGEVDATYEAQFEEMVSLLLGEKKKTAEGFDL